MTTHGETGTTRQLISDEQIMEALEQTKGSIYLAAKIIPCSSSTIFHRLKEKPELRQQLSEIKENLIEHVEDKLQQLIERDNFKAIEFFLSTQAKHHGYGRTGDININGNMTNTNYNLSEFSREELQEFERLINKATPMAGDEPANPSGD